MKQNLMKQKFMNKIDYLREKINSIRKDKGLSELSTISLNDTLRDDLDLDSFDLALLTSLIDDDKNIDIFENGLVDTIGEIIVQL